MIKFLVLAAQASDLTGPDLSVCKKYKEGHYEAFGLKEEYWTYCCNDCCENGESEIEANECTKSYCEKKCPKKQDQPVRKDECSVSKDAEGEPTYQGCKSDQYCKDFGFG